MLGDAAAFSFYPTKNLSAAGDAGMVTTAVERNRPAHPPLAGPWACAGVTTMMKWVWNSRIDTVQAAVLLVKLGFIDDWNAKRRALAETYQVLFEQMGSVEPGPYPQRE